MKKGLAMFLVMLLVSNSFGILAFADTRLISGQSKVTFGEGLQTLRIIGGDANGNLNGDKELTRGELIAIISKLETPKNDTFVLPTKPSFSDVPKTHWAYAFVERAKAEGITEGVGNGKFGINDKVTYKQAQAFMLNLLDIPYEWFDVQYDAILLGVESGEAMDSDTFTRDMMFEVLFNTLVCNNNEGIMYFDVVADTTSIGWDASDRAYMWEVYNAITNANTVVENSNDSSPSTLDPMLPILTAKQQDILALDATSNYTDYLEEFSGLKFVKIDYSELYNDLAIPYSERFTDMVALYCDNVGTYSSDIVKQRAIALLETGFVAMITTDMGVTSVSDEEAEDMQYIVRDVYKATTAYTEYDASDLQGYVVVLAKVTDASKVIKLVFNLDKNDAIWTGLIFGDDFYTTLY